MHISFWLLIALTAFEFILLALLLTFFARLRRSEQLLVKLQAGQKSLLDNLQQNAQIESDLISSFAERQKELALLDTQLKERITVLKRLLSQAETISRSPQFLRELVISGTRQGTPLQELAKSTGLSLDEVKLILAQANQMK